MKKEEKRIWDKYLTKFSAKIEGGLLKDLRNEMDKRSEIVKTHYKRLLDNLNITTEDTRNMLMDIFVYSVFDKYNWKLRSKGETPSKEYKRFKSVVTKFDYYLDEDLLYYAIKDECNELSNINKTDVERIIKSMSYLAQGLANIENFEFINFAESLRRHIMFNVSKDLPEKIYKIKSYYYGLLTMTKIKDNLTAIDSLKTSILCLPIGEQQIINMYLYLLLIVLNVWNVSGKTYVYSPLDNGVSEVLLSLGLTDKRIEDMEYENTGYKAYKIISEMLFPEEPSKMMVTRAVAERWCYQKKIKICDECWFNNVCPKEY
ncbi:MAG: hypothetical protein QXM35_00320 [Candidatus Methanomethylicia archaeon]